MLTKPSSLTSLARLLLGASLSVGALPTAFADAKTYLIAPSSLENTLNQFGREAGVLISFSSDAASGIKSRGLEGNYSPEQGLQPVATDVAPVSIELGTRYDNGNLRAEIGAFLINFDNQYDSNQTTDTVIARGETHHQGIKASVNYALDGLSPALAGFDVYASYAYVDATIREDGPNKGNRVPFSSKNKGSIGIGLIPGYMLFNTRLAYDFCQQLSDLNVAVGIKNILNHEYYTRSFDDNNKGKYVAEPRTLYVQTSVAF